MGINRMSIILLVTGMILLLIFKILSIIAVALNCEADRRRNTGVYVLLSIPFSVLTGIVCFCKTPAAEWNKKHKQSLVVFILALLFLAVGLFSGYKGNNNAYFGPKGEGYSSQYDITFYDEAGNTYNYDFDRHGTDYLYINDTEEKLPAHLCYLDEDAVLFYDKEMNITAVDETRCVDANGKTYYPVRYVDFDKNGDIHYHFKADDYDRLGNTYTYDYVPYYDRDGNKYGYSFDSSTQKGTYTNVISGECFDNDYAFVDKDGYFVYDSNHEFVKQQDSTYHCQYADSDGNLYYWASAVHWEKGGVLYDSYGNRIE